MRRLMLLFAALLALTGLATAQEEGLQYVFPGTVARVDHDTLVVDGKAADGSSKTMRFSLTESTARPVTGELSRGRTVVVRYQHLEGNNRAISVRFLRPREDWPAPTFPDEVSGAK
ncbi:MAG: hypothetical protein AB1758_28785 [Candidatus Eremiobacterota bacterium]